MPGPRYVRALLSAVLPLAAVLPLSGCPQSKGSEPSNRLLEDASFGRRVFRPPPSDPVRAVPPHNIHRRGVGPYELSASLQTTLALLPNGPRVELFEAEGLFDYRLMRSDRDALLLGVRRRGGVAFISVLDPDIARTESGVGVGAGVQELIGALGALKAPANQGRDSRIITFTALPDTRFIVEKGKVVAAVVMPPTEADGGLTDTAGRDPSGTAPEPICDLEAIAAQRVALRTLAKSNGFAPGVRGLTSVEVVCLGADRPGALVRKGDVVGWAISDVNSEQAAHVVSTATIPGLSFVTTLDTGAQRPEIFAVSERRSLKLREVVVTRLGFVSGRLVPNWSRVAFSMEAKTASWIGAQMQTADFLVEMTGRRGAVAVGGIYLERVRGALRHVVPVDQVEFPLGREAPRRPVIAAPTRDAGAPSSTRKDARPAAPIPPAG